MSTVAKPLTKLGSKSLKEYLNTSKKPSKIVGPVERHLLTRPLDTSRRQDVMHPSEMVKDDWCIRAEYFKLTKALRGEETPQERPGLMLQSIFDHGHAVHDKWQRYLAEMGALYGSWECVPCARRWDGSPDSLCNRCGRIATYRELRLSDPGLRIEGSTDGWVTLGDEMLLEIKTVGTGTIRAYDPGLLYDNDNSLEKAFADIRRPFRDHRRQVQMYLRLTHHMYDAGVFDRTPPKEAVILYECKSNQQFKEFTVRYSPEQTDDVFQSARVVVEALESGKAPKCILRNCNKCGE